jgi:hypothetical protein
MATYTIDQITVGTVIVASPGSMTGLKVVANGTSGRLVLSDPTGAAKPLLGGVQLIAVDMGSRWSYGAALGPGQTYPTKPAGPASTCWGLRSASAPCASTRCPTVARGN